RITGIIKSFLQIGSGLVLVARKRDASIGLCCVLSVVDVPFCYTLAARARPLISIRLALGRTPVIRDDMLRVRVKVHTQRHRNYLLFECDALCPAYFRGSVNSAPQSWQTRK